MPDECLVIGAGAAGLAAAGVLERAGIRAIILEARERIGGRIHTIHPSSCPVPVELGAEFVHGRPPEIWNEAALGGLAIEEVAGQQCYFEDGELRPLRERNTTKKTLELMRRFTEPDRSFAQFLQEAGRWIPDSDKEWATAYIEGFNAARKEKVSVRSLVMTEEAATERGGDRLFRLPAGYDSVVGTLWTNCAGAELRLGCPVRSLRWKFGEVVAECDSGSFSAACAIVTLPLAILQARQGEVGHVRFDPEVETVRTAASRLCSGDVIRITFVFRHRFWDWGLPSYTGRSQDLSMLHSLDPKFPTWWTSAPVKAPVITGWTSGSKAGQFVSRPAEKISHEAAESLARIFGVSASLVEGEIVASYVHDWQTDPFALGAYSYVPAGCVEDLTMLGLPVENTLFFAGEATHNSGRNGTVDGAIATGRRAAEEVIQRMRLV